MNIKKTILITALVCIFIVVVGITSIASKEPVNFCGHTIAEANDPVNWHNGIYSPEGCDLSKYKITR